MPDQQEEAKASSNVKAKLPSGGFRLFGAYFATWLVVLLLAKKIYNTWYSNKVASRRSKWFGGHPERDAYEAAVKELGALLDDPKTPLTAEAEKDGEERLRKLLLRRAMTDFRRILQINGEKESLYNLMRSGALSEEMWNEFKEAESEMQVELFDLQAEAETFKQGTPVVIVIYSHI
jgi:translocation protein SEC66